MHFDALTLAAIVDELSDTLVNGRVQQVIAPDEQSIGLEVYSQQSRRYLLLSADPQFSRVHLASHKLRRGAAQPSPLLQLLRKYVRGVDPMGVTAGGGRGASRGDMVDYHELAAGLQVRDVGRALEDFRHVEQIEVDADFVGHGWQMECGIRRAARCGHGHRRILEGLAGDDVARAQAVCDQAHDALPLATA